MTTVNRPHPQVPTGERGLLVLMQQFTVQIDRYIQVLSDRHGLHSTDLNALAAIMELTRQGWDATPGRLGEALNLSSPATTALINRLDRAGYVRRERGALDRRSVHVVMTDAAAAAAREMFTPLSERIGAVIDDFSGGERTVIERFLAEALEATVAARADAPDGGPED